MWVTVSRITVGELPAWAGGDLIECARKSDPLLTYHFGDELIAIVGFIPAAVITDTAYLWMESTGATAKHPLAVARLGRLTLQEIGLRYRRIIGECMAGSRSIVWLKWLGARFGEPNGAAVPFIIEV